MPAVLIGSQDRTAGSRQAIDFIWLQDWFA